ncbi:MAG: hypothetical protein AAF532_16825 [Planctomycetota bacterium]
MPEPFTPGPTELLLLICLGTAAWTTTRYIRHRFRPSRARIYKFKN